MKKEYSIGQICKLYNLGADSLRYYEKKGVLTPKRKENGYRTYELKHLFKLNIIKDLRKLGFSINQIKDYFEKRNIDSTIELMQSEINLVEKEIRILLSLKENLEEKLESIVSLKNIECIEKIEIKSIKERKIIIMGTPSEDSSEIDLAFRKLEMQEEDKLFLLGNKNMGVFLSRKGVEDGDYSRYSHAFFFINPNSGEFDAIIPKRDFVCLTYKGSYKKSHKYFEKIMNYIKEKGYILKGAPMEIYRIDIHETEVEDEFVTEIQVPVEKIK
jgi:DNA-binding transcriptional MerR regulator